MILLLFDVLLTVVAGFLDAVGFTYLSGLYVSFMSGNSTGFGVAIAASRLTFVLASASVIGGFVAGVFAGSYLVTRETKGASSIILAVEVGLIALSALLVDRTDQLAGFIPVCIAMGMQNAVAPPIAGVQGGRGYVTGALVGLGQALALAIKDRKHLLEAAIHLSSWLAIIVGATAGSLSATQIGTTCCLLVAAVGLLGLLAMHVCLAVKSSGAAG
jgi:uncharacterized membrane protein YoaK (UPF0700 family)